MKVGDLVTRLERDGQSDELGIVTELTHDFEIDEEEPHEAVFVRWNGNVDWDMEWMEELEVVSENR